MIEGNVDEATVIIVKNDKLYKPCYSNYTFIHTVTKENKIMNAQFE